MGFSDVNSLLWKEGDEVVSWATVFKTYSSILAKDLITCTKLDTSRKTLQRELILSMGGHYQQYLDKQVTVLVVGQTGTDKYKFAKREDIALVTDQWIRDCFQQRRRVDPAGYKPQIFLGLKFCATQVQAGVRSYIENEATLRGGEYTADLRKDHNTHLIAVRADGPKFEFAHKWKMKVVTPKWFFRCIEAGEYVDEMEFAITTITNIP